MMEKFYKQIFSCMEMIGMAGTRVYLDDDGNVRVDVLSSDDCLDIMELYRKGEWDSKEVTIFNSNDEKLL